MRRKPTGGETAKKIDKRQDFDESVFLAKSTHHIVINILYSLRMQILIPKTKHSLAATKNFMGLQINFFFFFYEFF